MDIVELLFKFNDYLRDENNIYYGLELSRNEIFALEYIVREWNGGKGRPTEIKINMIQKGKLK